MNIFACSFKPWPHRVPEPAWALTPAMAHIDLYLYNPQQVSVSYPFLSMHTVNVYIIINWYIKYPEIVNVHCKPLNSNK